MSVDQSQTSPEGTRLLIQEAQAASSAVDVGAALHDGAHVDDRTPAGTLPRLQRHALRPASMHRLRLSVCVVAWYWFQHCLGFCWPCRAFSGKETARCSPATPLPAGCGICLLCEWRHEVTVMQASTQTGTMSRCCTAVTLILRTGRAKALRLVWPGHQLLSAQGLFIAIHQVSDSCSCGGST